LLSFVNICCRLQAFVVGPYPIPYTCPYTLYLIIPYNL
jgi:hypothetical protein